jgi:hypothetical protein
MMGLESLNALILTANIDVARKVNLAICGMQFQHIDQNAAVKDLKRFYEINDDRNIVAHSFFGPPKDSDGVEFYRTTAKKELKIGKILWAKADFTEKV